MPQKLAQVKNVTATTTAVQLCGAMYYSKLNYQVVYSTWESWELRGEHWRKQRWRFLQRQRRDFFFWGGGNTSWCPSYNARSRTAQTYSMILPVLLGARATRIMDRWCHQRKYHCFGRYLLYVFNTKRGATMGRRLDLLIISVRV